MTQTLDTAASRETALRSFIEAFVAEHAPLAREYGESQWQMNVTGESAYADRGVELGTRLRQMYARPEAWAFLKGVADAGGVGDPHLARQLELLLNEHRAQQIPPETIARTVALEKSLEHRLNTHRAELDGERVTDNTIMTILRDSGDGALRRRAWEASKQVGAAIAGDLLELVRLRNRSAREIGFSDYYTMRLELQEVPPGELFDLLDRIERGTRAPFAAWRADLDRRLAARFGIAASEVRPWHAADPFFQQAPAADVELDHFYADAALEPMALGFFDAIGLDVHGVMQRSDLYEKPGKCQHAFCLPVDHSGDVRVLCNLRPDEKWMGTLLHELGHAAYEVHVDPALPWLLRTHAHLMSTEASAMLFGRLSRNAAWLECHAGVAAADAAGIAAAAREAVRVQLLLATRWILVMCHMERALYADPEQDLNALWWDLVERLQMMPRPEGRHAPDWAAKIHFTSAPVYYHNYLMGEMTASQLQHHLLHRVLGGGEAAWPRFVRAPEVGRFMRESFYASGRLHPWNETLRRATGETLRAEPFIAELTRAG